MNISQINKDIYSKQNKSEVLTKANDYRNKIINKISNEVIQKIEKDKIKILDIGCRDAGYFDRLKSSTENKKLELIGLDNVEKFIRTSRKKGYEIIDHDLDKPLPFKKEEFDIINCQQVIEHLLDTQEFTRDMYRKLKRDGYLIIGLPNFASLMSRIRFLFGFKPLQYSPVLQWSFGNHKSMFTLRDIKKLLKDNNFKIEKIVGVDLFLSWNNYNKGVNLSFLARLFPSLAQKVILVVRKNL